jgi:hypothetical protein
MLIAQLFQLFTPPQTEVTFIVEPQVSRDNCYFYEIDESGLRNEVLCQEHSLSISTRNLNFNYLYSDLDYKFITDKNPSSEIDFPDFQAYLYPVLAWTINGELQDLGDNDFCLLSHSQASCHHNNYFFTIFID